jgi:DNA-binding response OmpR family regulator
VKIVVVDDEPSIVLMCRRVLESHGHAVQGFTDVKAALACLETDVADLLVVDYKMPELNGLEFIKRAWALRPGLRVVMITAHGTREVREEATGSGVTTIVLKPFTPTELAQGVAAAIGGSPPAPDARSA